MDESLHESFKNGFLVWFILVGLVDESNAGIKSYMLGTYFSGASFKICGV